SKSLFSADAFGSFGASYMPLSYNIGESARYYFNICGKFGPQVQALLKKASTLDIQTVYPLHGPILKGDELAKVLEIYGKWSLYEPDIDGVFIPYASIYGHTAEAARLLAGMLRQKGVHAVTLDLARCDKSLAVAMAFRFSKMVLAAATYDASIFPPMADFLHRLQVKTYRNRRVGLIQNGSWAPTAAITMKKILETMKGIEIVEPVVTVTTRLNAASTEALSQLADALH
ncbi:MAG: FprA family A-type flavoprotein, partial [Paramuribaculum sp.]|nr:FprA family A-type flavoprotein [Paramuribaculum sp.]